MGKSYRFFETFAVGLALACAALASQPAYAETVPPTLSCDDVTVPEGTSGQITCMFSNTTSPAQDVTIASTNPFSASLTGLVGPDPTDSATRSGFSGSGSSPCKAGETLSPGQSCGFAVDLTTDKWDGGTDLDGVNSFLISVNSNFHGTVDTTTNVTVADPPTAVPEPASVVLLGMVLGSLVGALGLLRRKLL